MYHDSGYRPRVENSWNRFKTLSKLRCVVVLHFDRLVCFYVYATDILLACLRLANLIVIELFTWLSTRVPAWCRFLGFLFHSHLSHVMTKPTKWHVRPAKTQISLGIRPICSESSLSTCKKLGSLATHWAHSEDWSDLAEVQADLGLRWAHSHFVSFVMRCSFDDLAMAGIWILIVTVLDLCPFTFIVHPTLQLFILNSNWNCELSRNWMSA